MRGLTLGSDTLCLMLPRKPSKVEPHFVHKAQAKAQAPMADLAPGLSQEERKVLWSDGLTAARQLTVCGLGGSEVHLPFEDNMTVEDLRKSVARRIGLHLGGMLVLTAGGNALDDSKPLFEQVQGDVITYVVQQVALAMFICFLSLFGPSMLFWKFCRRVEKPT